MKLVAFSALLLFSLATPSPVAAATSQMNSPVSLQLGAVTVSLGMPQGQAIAMMERAGFRVVSRSQDGKMMFRDGPALYSVAFKGDNLVYADREWLLSQKDEISAVLGALGAIAPRSAAPCTVNHARVNNPALQSERIFVHCGTRSVLIVQDKDPGTDSILTDVYEFIGTYEQEKK